ncbi:MAG: hypothetical protein LBQ58_05335 [Synergistaceae bacterium]|jgi:hypothetical protein|nr:hypothetical protein [Synergistaceae bacterium]
MNYQLEIQRNNVTPSEFFSYIRKRCKVKGIEPGIDLDLDQFANHQGSDYRYYVEDEQKICYADGYRTVLPADTAPCKSEICRELPYDWQFYFRNFDGSFFNVICEFTFSDESRGFGYFYTANQDAEEENNAS